MLTRRLADKLICGQSSFELVNLRTGQFVDWSNHWRQSFGYPSDYLFYKNCETFRWAGQSANWSVHDSTASWFVGRLS